MYLCETKLLYVMKLDLKNMVLFLKEEACVGFLPAEY